MKEGELQGDQPLLELYCSSIESKRCEIGCMFGRRGMDVLALCETKMKGKGEVAFGEVTGRVSGVERGRAREGVALLVALWCSGSAFASHARGPGFNSRAG